MKFSKLEVLFAVTAFVLAFWMISGNVFSICNRVGVSVGFQGKYLFLVIGVAVYVYISYVAYRMLRIAMNCMLPR